ncbi:MAG: signal peptide peptidase SppA [Saprospiraceae bacterium]
MEQKNKSTFTPSLLGSCLGVIVSFALIGLIIALAVMNGSKGESTYVKSNSILHLKLEGLVPEKTGNTADQNAFFSSGEEAIGLNRLCNIIEYASKDDKIKGIFLENSSISMGQATLLALSNQLVKFKESGKFIYSYSDAHSQSSYFLCSVADSMYLNPRGMVDLRGYGSMIPFFKSTLDKLGVKMEVFYAGDFKSASEPFRLDKMSDSNRLQIKEFLKDMKSILSETIYKHREISAEKLEVIMNEYLGRSAQRSLDNKLVDVLCQKSEFDEMLKKKMGVKDDKSVNLVSLSSYNKTVKVKEKDVDESIAIVYAEGEIAYGDDMKGVITKNKYSKIFNKILHDENIKAVVLRVNSPGGDAFTSEVIWDYVEKIKAKGIPVIASYGDYAASGGYYISCNADHIIAQPNTLTGSIGVFAMFPNVQDLTENKLGINFDTVKTNDFAVALSPFQDLSEREKNLMQESVLEIYDLFVERVSKGRKLSLDSTKVIARGRVWTGSKAKEIGLVDELGGMDEALKKAKELANIEEYKIVEYPSIKTDFFSEILREIEKGQEEEMMQLYTTPEQRKIYQFIQNTRYIIDTKRIQARLPFLPDFN